MSAEWLEDPVMLKVKRWCMKQQGNNGVRSVVRFFRSADRNQDAKLSYAEFSSKLRELGLKLTDGDIRHLCIAFDTNEDEFISISEFLTALYSGLPPRRRFILQRIWSTFDKDQNGDVALDQVIQAYHIEQHPKVLAGELSPDEAAANFNSYFNWDMNPEGLITEEEFFAFYAGVSSNIGDDEYFETLLSGVWDLEEVLPNETPSFGTTKAAAMCPTRSPRVQGTTASSKVPPSTSKVMQGVYAHYGTNSRSYNIEHSQSNPSMVAKHRMTGDGFNPPSYQTQYMSDFKRTTHADRPLVQAANAYVTAAPRDPSRGQAAAGPEIVEQVRALILKKGGKGGYRSLSRVLRIMDDNGNKLLDKYELQNGIQTYGLKLTARQMDDVMAAFDRDGSGQVSVAEFIQVLRGPMNERRVGITQEAYMILAEQPVTFTEMKELFDYKRHPDVLNKEKTGAQVLQEFASGWDLAPDAQVTWDDFYDYYNDISAGIDDDDAYEFMLRNVWHVSGGSGKSANTPFRRVLVIHTNGKQTVQEIRNDLRIRDTDIDLMMQNLRDQGVPDIKKISLATV